MDSSFNFRWATEHGRHWYIRLSVKCRNKDTHVNLDSGGINAQKAQQNVVYSMVNTIVRHTTFKEANIQQKFTNVLGECHTDYSNPHRSRKTNSSGQNSFGSILISSEDSPTTSFTETALIWQELRSFLSIWILDLASVMKQYFRLCFVFYLYK